MSHVTLTEIVRKRSFEQLMDLLALCFTGRYVQFNFQPAQPNMRRQRVHRTEQFAALSDFFQIGDLAGNFNINESRLRTYLYQKYVYSLCHFDQFDITIIIVFVLADLTQNL